ncbi:MAG TPA: DNA repair exonuclease [Oscillospiraceae bacterium]|nr:DNA repair exonuclease [Oscillospiraceae bacterium]
MLKVLHTGDLHLGIMHTTRNYPEELRQNLVQARLTTLARLVEQANQTSCHLFVIAGDLFNSHNVTKELVLETIRILNRFTGACVAVLPGNHDFYTEMITLWQTFLDQAPEQIILLSQQKPYPLQDFGLDVVLYPAPCDRRHSATNRLGWLAELTEQPAGKWHLGVAHGTLRGISPDLDDSYFPMERDELLRTGLQHWFLGHTHSRYPDLEQTEETGFAYCGTPEPDGFDCSHSGYAWLTTFSDGKVLNQSLATGQYQFAEKSLEIRDLAAVEKFFTEIAAETLLLKLSLTGRLPREEYQQRAGLLKQCATKVAYLEYDDSLLRMELSAASIAAEFPVGSFPHLLLTSLADAGDREALQLAYELVKKVKK